MMLSIIIPVYHCEGCLVLLYERIVQTINVLDDITDYEIIFIEDCGQDGSWDNGTYLRHFFCLNQNFQNLKINRIIKITD